MELHHSQWSQTGILHSWQHSGRYFQIQQIFSLFGKFRKYALPIQSMLLPTNGRSLWRIRMEWSDAPALEISRQVRRNLRKYMHTIQQSSAILRQHGSLTKKILLRTELAFPTSGKHINFQGSRNHSASKRWLQVLTMDLKQVYSRITHDVAHQAKILQVKIGYGKIRQWLDLDDRFYDQVINKTSIFVCMELHN